MHSYIHTYIHTYIYIIRAFNPSHTNASKHKLIHVRNTHIHAYIHTKTHLHTYTHIHA